MRIAIDTSPLNTGHTNRGVGQYSKNLIEALKKYESDHSYLLFDSKKDTIPQADIVHFPYFDPFFLTLPFHKPKETVVTVHDLIPLVFPDKFLHGIRGDIKWYIQRFSLLRSQRIITDSISSREDTVKFTGFDRKRIDVVYLAPADVYSPKKNQDDIKECKKIYHLHDRFMIYVGDLNWNKNISGLLRAFRKMTEQIIDVSLVLVGKSFLDTGLLEAQEIHALIQSLKIQDKVNTVGFVEEKHLRTLYQMALCSLTPSHYEGFGLPVLEAMASGCPVICSANSSLNEIAGPSIRIDSRDTASLVRAMKHMLLLTGDERKTLINMGLKWVDIFSWKKVARETVQSYERAREGRYI